MADINWAAGEEARVAQGIKDVRNDASDVDWTLVTFASTSGASSTQLKQAGTGTGGITALKGHLPEDNIAFALVRVTDKIDMSVTVKFVWINWIGPKTPRMMQSKLSVQLGAIKQYFQPFSTDLTIHNQDELSHEIVMERVLAYSVSGNKVIDATGGAAYRAVAATSGTGKVSAATGKMADGPVTFADGLRQQVNAIRDDNSGVNWVLIGYSEPSKPHLILLGKGSGGVSELKSHLSADNVAYGLVRKIERIDDTDAVKFCYIRWIGKDIPFMQRAKLGTHSGDISEFFHPYHTSLDAPELVDVTDENVMKLIQTASGTYKHVLDDAAAARAHSKPAVQKPASSGAAPAAQNKPVSSKAPTQAKPVPATANDDVVTVGAGIREAIQSVRNDTNLTDWALVTYEFPSGKNQSKSLVLVGTGEGGLSELKSKLGDSMVGYALYRTTDKVDDSDTVKFVFIDWRGPQVHRMQRAILGTHSGAVRAIFEPYHVDLLDVSKQEEVTEDLIMAKVRKAAGTANYVL